MLKFHFTGADMARIRMAAGPDPMWELLLSLHLLGGSDGSVVFGAWKRHIRSRLPNSTRLLFDLAPPRGYSADFLTPMPDRGELEPGIDAVLSTSRGRLRHDVARLATVRPLGSRTLSLAEAGSAAMLCLGAALRGYFNVALQPYWAQVGSSIKADRAVRVRAILDGGTEGMLATLHPSLRWQPGILTVASAYERDIRLDGRGLLLLPSFFCWRAPITLRDPGLPPVIVYPIAHDLRWSQADAGQGRDGREALGTLLGRTRADVLAAIADGGGSTSELARRLVVSPASVSQHAAALRDSGLIVTHRRGQSVHHSATALGSALLDGHRRIPQPSRRSPAVMHPM
ncbi:winged helix-turn-helix domain-containing protein [Streptomyces sp. DG2A-72]|uniref:ArsR/SmtB family transcription factor n=1 Tax=Streptomyces sp. DG2A-72 TaxID=3051386 RepID=UPI00265B98BA|nr:winged helix-turn-helix domain-containing protein [Streptomyces sp. DG2A-72]MDO0937779.1 winged helix-turn-helix domain-containing protein [Streptomyces sp. DG2A-72]